MAEVVLAVRTTDDACTERARRRRAARALGARQRERHAVGVACRSRSAPRRRTAVALGGVDPAGAAATDALARALGMRVVVGASKAAAAASACRGRAAVRHPWPQRRQRRSSARRARSGPRLRRWRTGPRRTATGRVSRAGYAPALARPLRRRQRQHVRRKPAIGAPAALTPCKSSSARRARGVARRRGRGRRGVRGRSCRRALGRARHALVRRDDGRRSALLVRREWHVRDRRRARPTQRRARTALVQRSARPQIPTSPSASAAASSLTKHASRVR